MNGGVNSNIEFRPTFFLFCFNRIGEMNTQAMSSHMSYLFIFFFLLIHHFRSTSVEAQMGYLCLENGNYTANSLYSTNLNKVLSLLPSNIGNSGFFNSSIGDAPDRSSVTALCRADLQLEYCRNCIRSATAELANLCPWRKQAFLWNDVCTLRYSNKSIIGVMAESPDHILRNPYGVSSVQQFNDNLNLLLDDLRLQAVAGGSIMKVAVGNRSGSDLLTIYALLQCTPDISSSDCNQCLTDAVQSIPVCCPGLKGLRIIYPSCVIRYETDATPFYNLSRIREAEELVMAPPLPGSPPPLPGSPPPERPVTEPPGNGGGSTTVRTITIIVVPIIGCLILVACLAILLRRKQRKKMPQETDTITNEEEMGNAGSLQYDFEKIRAATNDFSEDCKLGHGGFGVVYKGILESGEEVAVKRLSRGSAQGDLEFKNEVLLVAKLQHRNLVRLFGFAIEGMERLLIYEFVQNASLDRFIFDSVKHSYIDWDRRYKIIGGIARGLLYLHEDSRFRIIHRDLKASNILLDVEMNPKIADFGMARLFVPNESEYNTSRVVGTYGYMAPEYALHGQLSLKIDVFSFGVLVLEIVSGQKNNSFMIANKEEGMLSFAWRIWHEGLLEDLIDPTLRSGSGLLRDMVRCIHIGLLCVQEDAAARPTMSSVVLMLNSSSVTMPVPSQPPFFMSRNFNSSSRDMGFNRSVETEVPLLVDPSINDASITELSSR